MKRRSARLLLLAPVLLAPVLLAACAPARSITAPTAAPPAANAPAATVRPVPVAETPAPAPRSVADSSYSPFAAAEGLTLLHPSARVERVAFHESNHDGARQLDAAPTAVRATTLETRERGTGSRTAADVVVEPGAEIRAPVTGTVKRAGSYVLYCDHSDDFVVIAPDTRPAWEVKVLHISGVAVRPGDRVEAGVTVLAPGPTKLPFESQVDEIATASPWPHVHVEVVDPSIPDRPTPGGGCS